jgi:hypothetical protein
MPYVDNLDKIKCVILNHILQSHMSYVCNLDWSLGVTLYYLRVCLVEEWDKDGAVPSNFHACLVVERVEQSGSSKDILQIRFGMRSLSQIDQICSSHGATMLLRFSVSHAHVVAREQVMAGRMSKADMGCVSKAIAM